MPKKQIKYYDIKSIILQKIKENGGWVNCHAHIDRAFTLTEENFKLANKFRHEKWKLNKEIKKNSTASQIYDRMAAATELLLEQEVKVIGTFIDVDSEVKDKSIQAAQKLRNVYKNQVIFKFANNYNLLSEDSREWFDLGSQFVDIIGGILKMAKGKEDEYLSILFDTAKKQNKMVHVHIDELNTPDEKETEILALETIKHNLIGKIVGIHAISLNAHPKAYRENVYKLIKKADMMIVSNPMSWLDARRNEILAPIHNPIAPVDEMISHGVTVGIGVDNIADIFLPMNDGSMWNDLKALIYENRLYNIDEAIKIATVNGRKILGVE